MKLEVKNLKIEIYTPPQYVIELRDALNQIGACHVGNYDHVISFQNSKGCWRPLEGSSPFSGEVGKISQGEEVKMELYWPRRACEESCAGNQKHPSIRRTRHQPDSTDRPVRSCRVITGPGKLLL